MGSILAIPIAFCIGLICTKFSGFIEWVKWIVSYNYIEACRRGRKKRFDLYDYSAEHDPVKVSFLVPQEEYDLEGPQPEDHLRKKEDEIFFCGSNSKSETLIVRVNRKCLDKAEASLFVKLESGKVLQLAKPLDFQQSCTDEMTFSCGGLQLQCLSPMRRWRLFYAGYLQEVSEDTQISGKQVYVKFAFLWKAASDIYDFGADISSKTLADGLTRTKGSSLLPQLNELEKALDFYGHAGTIHGHMTVENEFEDKEMYLFGHRIRYLGDISHFGNSEFHHVLGYVKKNGTYVHVAKISAPKYADEFSFGFVVQPDTTIKSIEAAIVSISSNDQAEKVEAAFNTDFGAYDFTGSSNCLNSPNKDIESSNTLKTLEFTLNREMGFGVLIKRSASRKIDCSCFHTEKIQVPKVIPPVVSFKDKVCQLSEVTGGKGSSLGKLTHLSEELQNFLVPSGVVVTTAAYSSFLTKDILQEIKLLEEVSYKKGSTPEKVSEACKRVQQVIINTQFSNELRTTIESKLKEHFQERILSEKYAVRSSATGEDTEQMSAAGQMDTYLGISGIDEILLAVKKCWASQFSFIATEYKRRYGQCYNSPMAVVIQEMISCEVAGVLFTCDPLTGNPSLMSITANYGLGESVVSGSEEPDTVDLRRGENDEIEIKSINIGQKSRKIVVGETETKLEEVSEDQRNVCSLSDEMILQLGSLAIKIEKYYHSYRDIEWGFFNKKLYIFQSRPVTSSSKESIFEIEHEFDCAMRVENDFYSVSNVGEVVPKSFSTLGMEMSQKNFKIVLNSDKKIPVFQLRGKAQYYSKAWVMMHQHFMFNVADVFPVGDKEDLSTLKKANIISFFGRIPENDEMYEVSRARYGLIPEQSASIWSSLKLLRTMLVTSQILKKTVAEYSTWRIPIEKYSTAKELYDAVIYTCASIVPVSECAMIVSQMSAVLNMMIFSTLGAARGGNFDDVVYKDFANLVKTSHDVESADVPSATQDIALQIAEEMKPDDFKKMTVEEALNWLQTSKTKSGEKFRTFMERHGHRCLQEYDIYSIPWRETPESLVQLLQSLVGSAKKITEKKSEDIFANLNVPLGRVAWLTLKCVVPFARKCVQYRETAKSLVVKTQDEWRKGMRKLSQLMVQEGRLPEEDLLFFMTIEEIQCLLETRSPKIISKSIQRKKRYPYLNEFKFPEIMKGFPKPRDNQETEVINEVNFSMQGIPVSQGVAKGFVRKAITLEEASSIKPGEILVTYSTDIGWTPYFPHLAGVVTELGGLISHGAVVSREYGIPCIAGLHGATRQFQTGDYVILDGNRGILQKIQPPGN